MDSSKIDALKIELAVSLRDIAGVRAVYLFGSALHSHTPRDADLLVVYQAPLTPMTAPSMRNRIEQTVSTTLELPAHLMFFTEREAREFRARTKFALVFSSD